MFKREHSTVWSAFGGGADSNDPQVVKVRQTTWEQSSDSSIQTELNFKVKARNLYASDVKGTKKLATGAMKIA
jgi:hypothetical protein